MSINYEYDAHWKDLGTVLVYNHPNFQFNRVVVLVDFEGCLINKLPTTQLYHAINPNIISPYREDFIKTLKKEATEVGVIIVSNVFGSGKLVIDSLKRKVESFYNKYNIPALAFFTLKPNKFSKPHTGIWTLINVFYKKHGHSITKACVVSDFGGRLVEREARSGAIRVIADRTDMDRSFAHNINTAYKTISEYLSPGLVEKFNWNNMCLSPEDRTVYIEKLSQYVNPNIFKELFSGPTADVYMIMVYGAPRSGKTTLCKLLLNKWRTSKIGETRAIRRFGRDKYTKNTLINQVKKNILDRINIIVDGHCHTDELRAPFIELAEMHKVKYVVVEVNPGINMAYIFNHIAVEMAQSEDIVLYDTKDYYHYNSLVSRPPGALLYCPEMQPIKQLLEFRY